MNPTGPRKIKHIDQIQDVSPDQAPKVMKDFQWSGADVSSELQPNGKMKIVAKFYEGARYPTTGISVLQR